MAYAERTEIAAEKSRAEIEKVLKKYGARQFGYMSKENSAVIVFEVHDKAIASRYQVKFEIRIPDETKFRTTHLGKSRTDIQVRSAIDQEERRLWRSLLLCVKAKLEAVSSGIATFEQEFFSYIVVPGTSETVGDKLIPDLRLSANTNDARPLLGYDWSSK